MMGERGQRVPEKFENQPALVAAIIDARRVQMETEDTGFAIEWLMDAQPQLNVESASRALNDQTFRYEALYPTGHPGLDAMKAEQRAKGRRAYQLSRIRAAVIDRDDSRCQFCKRRVSGRDATLDHKDPEGDATMENVHLLCRRCNTIKGNRTWEEFLREDEEWRAALKRQQDARPDFTCQRTGLSVRGRSWADAGCVSPDICKLERECDNGAYAEWAAEMDARLAKIAEL